MFRRICIAGALALAIQPGGLQAQVVPHGFDLQPVVLDPFDANPVGFAFLPDGRILVLEKNTGNVRLATVGETTSTTILTIPGVGFTFEGGLLGVAVDPAWPVRPFIYFHVSQNNSVIHW